eukprot:SAG31_NODE_431_length_15775_cov_3.350663_4_plen_267_part_00
MLFWIAPDGFPDELSELDGEAAAIVSAISDDEWLFGFSAGMQSGVLGSSYLEFRSSDASQYFSIGMTLYSIFRGDFRFSSTVDTDVTSSLSAYTPRCVDDNGEEYDNAGDCDDDDDCEWTWNDEAYTTVDTAGTCEPIPPQPSVSTGDVTLELYADAGFDFEPLVDALQSTVRVLMKYDKYIEKLFSLLDLVGEDLCKKLGVPKGICKLVPGIVNVAEDILSTILRPLEGTLNGSEFRRFFLILADSFSAFGTTITVLAFVQFSRA